MVNFSERLHLTDDQQRFDHEKPKFINEQVIDWTVLWLKNNIWLSLRLLGKTSKCFVHQVKNIYVKNNTFSSNSNRLVSCYIFNFLLTLQYQLINKKYGTEIKIVCAKRQFHVCFFVSKPQEMGYCKANIGCALSLLMDGKWYLHDVDKASKRFWIQRKFMSYE